MSEIGLQMYTLRNMIHTQEELETAFFRASGIGYKLLQMKCPAYMTMKQFKTLLDRYDMRIDSLRFDTHRIEAEIESIIRESEMLGAKSVRIESMNADLARTPEGFLKWAEIMEKAGSILLRHGLRLWYHFHAFEFINFQDGKRGIDLLLENTSSEAVWFQPDLFWLTAAGTEASDSLKLFAGRAVSVHVKDYQIIERTAEMERVPRAFSPVGCGNMNWKRIIPTAKEMGIEHFIVEQDQCRSDPFECIDISYKNLKKMGI